MFQFNMLQNALARCPHCRKMYEISDFFFILVCFVATFFFFNFRSSVGPDYAKAKAIFFLVLAVILFVFGGGIAYLTLSYAKEHSGFFIIHLG